MVLSHKTVKKASRQAEKINKFLPGSRKKAKLQKIYYFNHSGKKWTVSRKSCHSIETF